MSNKRSEKPVRPMTIRFPEDKWAIIEKRAKKAGVNKTDYIRMTFDDNLARYLGNIRIIDEEQAAEIKELIRALLNEISAVKIELHRIGVNYNQEIRLRQIERKYAGSGMDVNTLFQRHAEEEQVKSECRGFSKEDMDDLIARYEKATAKVGEILCRILT